MKMSVIFGVLHMAFGLVMKAFNSCYFGKKLDFKHEFIPQIVMLLCMFGYMDVLIITKWLTNYAGHENMAPSIISTMVSMFLGGPPPEHFYTLYSG